jgi:uncharacterized protein (TIGR02231 family)
MNQIFESIATKVTLFEDRAEVFRDVTFSANTGLSWIQIRGASLFVDDRSVQAKPLTAGFSILGVRVLRSVVYESVVGHEERQRLEREGEELVRAREVWLVAQQRAEQKKQHIEILLQQWAKILQSNVKLGQSSSDTTKESFEVLQSELFAAHQEEQRTQEELRKREEAAQNLSARFQEANIKKPRYESLIEVQIRADHPQQEAKLELHYFTPAALWRPEHLARLLVDHSRLLVGQNDADWIPPASAHSPGFLEITTFASTWQRTGEDWSHVSASFSTARPAREATPPLLRSEILDLRRKTEEEKQNIVIEAREQKIQTVTATTSTPSQAPEMPGVDDGGQPLLYTATEKVSLVSDGQPFRVEIGKLKVSCEVSRVLLPEKMPVAYFRANATLPGPKPLLAGPVQLAREAGFVGKNKIDFIGPGEPFELGFGVDDAVRVRRQSKEQRDTTLITGTQKLKRTITLWLSNLSEEPKGIELIERIPVSEIEDIEVSLLESEDAKFDVKDGFVKKAITLEALGTSEFTLVYEVRAGSKVRMPF